LSSYLDKKQNAKGFKESHQGNCIIVTNHKCIFVWANHKIFIDFYQLSGNQCCGSGSAKISLLQRIRIRFMKSWNESGNGSEYFFLKDFSLFCLIHKNNKVKKSNQNHSWVELYFMIEVGSGSRAGTVISRKGSGSWSNWNGSVTLPEMEGIRVGLKRIIMYYIRYIWYICKLTVLLFAQV